jgi:small subunit ribosomal protein S6
MAKKYELVCILDPQVGENQFEPVVEKYEKYLTDHGAEMAHIDKWGLRKLAFSSVGLKRRQQGYYVLYQFEADSDMLGELEHELKMDEGVIRHLVVSVKGEFLRVPTLAPEDVHIYTDTRPRGGRPGGRYRDRDRDRGRGGPGGRRPDYQPRPEAGGPPKPEGDDAPAAAEGEAPAAVAAPAKGDEGEAKTEAAPAAPESSEE